MGMDLIIDYNIIAYTMAGVGIILAVVWRLFYKAQKKEIKKE